jgi:uncharacterized membrane protein YkvA (DUF1232 family)
MDDRFAEMVAGAILSLPQDLKAVLRIVEDPEIDDEGRVAAAGAIVHVLSSANAIPGMRGILAYVDDVLVLRLILERLEKTNAEAMERHREDSPELLEPLEEQLEVARGYLGNLMTVLDQAAAKVHELKHEGYTARQCVSDEEAGKWLYDAVHEAIVEKLELDEDDVVRETKHVDQILPHLKSRVLASS